MAKATTEQNQNYKKLSKAEKEKIYNLYHDKDNGEDIHTLARDYEVHVAHIAIINSYIGRQKRQELLKKL